MSDPGMTGRGRRIAQALVRPAHLVNAWVTRQARGPEPGLFTASRVEIKFDGVNWTDVTEYLTAQPIKIRYGRATEFDDVTPGVLTLQLYNGDGRFMPDNVLSPLYPNMVEDKEIRYTIFRGLRGWGRFRGWIRSIEPSFPTGSTTGAVVTISAVDNLGVLATYPLISQWLSAIRYYAGLTSSRWDGIVATGDGEASVDFDNVTDSPGAKATARVVAATNNRGTVRFGPAEGLSMEGSVQLTPASTNAGAVIRVDLPVPIRLLQFWVRLPGQIQVSASLPQLDIVVFRDGLNNNLGSIRLTNNAGLQDVGWFNAAGAFVTQAIFNAADERWVRVTVVTDTATPTTSDITWDGGVGTLNNQALDLRNVRTIWFGGLGTLVAKAEFAGIATMSTEGFDVPAHLGQTGSTAGGSETVVNRIAFLQQRVPVIPFTATNGDYTRKCSVGNWHGRNALTVCNEIIRTANGVTFARPRDSTVLCLPRNLLYPSEPVLILDAEGDLLEPPKLQRSVDSKPTRVEVDYPTGRATVINEAAETASQGQIRSRTITTIAATQADAADVGDEVLYRTGLGLRVTRMVVDLETGITDPVPALFEDRTTVGGLFPSQRLRLVVPESHFGTTAVDMHVEGWTEIYDAVGGCRIEFDLSPAAPPVTDLPFEVVSSSSSFEDGPVTGGTVTVSKPRDVQKDSLLVAIHWTDNDGSLATMTAPEGWVQRSSNSAPAGFGKLWTKVATLSEPGSYQFGTDTDAMGQVTILNVTGADLSSPLLVNPTWSSLAVVNSSHTAASLSPASSGLLVCGWMFVFGPPTGMLWTIPGSMAAAGELSQAGTYMQVMAAHEAVGSGATGTRTATSSISSSALGNHRVSFVLRPAP